MSACTVSEGAALDRERVGALGLPVIAIKQTDGSTTTLLTNDRTIEADERLFVVGHLTHLQHVEVAATGTGECRTSHVSFETYWRDQRPLWA